MSVLRKYGGLLSNWLNSNRMYFHYPNPANHHKRSVLHVADTQSISMVLRVPGILTTQVPGVM